MNSDFKIKENVFSKIFAIRTLWQQESEESYALAMQSKELNTRFGYKKVNEGCSATHVPLPALKGNPKYMLEANRLDDARRATYERFQRSRDEICGSFTLEEYFIYRLTTLPYFAWKSDFDKVVSVSLIKGHKSPLQIAAIAGAVGLEARLVETACREDEREFRIRQLTKVQKGLMLSESWTEAKRHFGLSRIDIFSRFEWKRWYKIYEDERDLALLDFNSVENEYGVELCTPHGL